MPKASVTRHIEREKQKLIDFVLDIEKYPEFIPFCIDSKVYETNDAGSTWINISGSNLPGLPVNCITYQGGTNDDLFIYRN